MTMKAETKKLSAARTKNWPDTVQAKKKNKANTKFERFKKSEENNRRID